MQLFLNSGAMNWRGRRKAAWLRALLAAAVIVPFLAGWVTGADVAPARVDYIEFLNGDSLHGEFRGMSAKDGKITWTMESSPREMTFSMADVTLVQLGNAVEPAATNVSCVLQTISGDRLAGELRQLSSDSLEYECPNIGLLRIARSGLRTAFVGDGSSTVFDIAKDHAGLEQGVVYRDGALIAHWGKFKRRGVNLPQALEARINIQWRGQDAYLGFMIMDKDKHDVREGYCFGSYGDRAFIHSMLVEKKMGIEIPGPGQTEYVFMADRKSKRAAIVANGRPIVDGRVPADKNIPDSKTISLDGDTMSVVKFNTFTIHRWDGRLTNEQSRAADTLVVANDDHLSGTLREISKETARLDSPLAKMNVPMKDVVQIQFAMHPEKVAAPKINTSRLTFANGDTATLDVLDADGKQIRGVGAFYGSVTMQRSLVRRMEFNAAKQNDCRRVQNVMIENMELY